MSEQTDSIEPTEPAAPQADGKVAAPGWYPVGPDIQRYWDGEQWTDHTAPLAQQAPPVPSPAARWADLFGAAPNYTGGVPVDEWLEAHRG